jgi:hypothetical protein
MIVKDDFNVVLGTMSRHKGNACRPIRISILAVPFGLRKSLVVIGMSRSRF